MKKRIILLTLAVLLTALLLLTSSFAAGDDASRSADQGSVTTNEDITIYTVTIEYVYGDNSKFKGQRVAVPYIAEVAAGETLTGTVTSPNCVGYTPNQPSFDLSTLGPINGHRNVVVTYDPAQVSYTVRHYQQNIDNDEYTWVDTTMATGYTEALTSDAAAKTYTGFTALPHYHEEIAADSSTMIDIYYDRNYYLMSFDLQGGFGVEPIYARYGAPISVGTPYQPGWTFNGWDKTIPSTMPAEDTSYTAFWTAKKVPFTVAYWLEDANIDGKYNFWGSTQLTETAGKTVQGEDYKDNLNDAGITNTITDVNGKPQINYDKRYSTYSKADIDVTIKGDGSTVVNVYYNRNKYTLKFYYAMSSGNGTNTKYYVIGGSTYYFGNNAGGVDKTDGVSLLDQYMSTYVNQRGEVDELPGLNDKGKNRNYTTGSDFSTVNSTAYTYHYISFQAKYGADMSSLWPCDVFNSVTRTQANTHGNWAGTEAFVSAWNGEHHVWYTQNNGNQTIKGNYNELDYKLLWDYSLFGDTDTVSYLCFWENGANIGWSIPELYRYNIYVQNTNGTDYEPLRTYDTVDDSNVNNQTAPANNGFTYTRMDSASIENPNPSLYASAYVVNFYYDRDKYSLNFVNGGVTEKSEPVYFGAGISDKAPAVTYYDKNLADMYVFGGWYTSPNTLDGSEYDLTDATMPANPLTLYAKWNLITHDVSIYKTEDDAENSTNPIGTADVTHDEPVPEDSHPDTVELVHPTDPSATFLGWFYKDENGKEQAFDFATMTITRDMTIYAKWRSNEMKQVNIRYVIENEDGTETEIADSETMMLRLGQTRTFEAKTGSSLFLEYRTGCFPTTASHSITIKNEDIDNKNPVTYTFVYKQYGKVPYQVEFYVQLDTDADGDGKLDLRSAYKNENGKAVFVSVDDYKKDSTYNPYVEEHRENDKAVVTELYVPDGLADETWTLPDEYFPNALKIQKVIVPSETDPNDIKANVIQFIYTYTEPEDPDDPVYKARYLVQHFIQNPSEQTQYDLYSYSDEEGLSGEKATASPISIPGYTFSSAETDARMQTGTNLADNVMSGTITADDSLELNFYYTVNSYPYQVMYLEKDTNRVLLEAKTEDSNGLLTGRYGSRVSYTLGTEAENALLSDYDVDADTKSIYIQMEAGGTANVNTIVFYYTRKSADLIVSKTVELDAEQAKEEGISQLPEAVLAQKFTFTVTCPTGFHKSVYDCTVTDGSGETKKDVVAGTTTMTFTLEHGQTIKIHDLAMGDYTVAETYVPGFRTSVNQTIQQEYPVNLETNNVDVTAPFLNSYPFYTGDLVIMKKVAKADTSDPNATEPYKVTVVLKPDAAAREVDRVITWTDADGSKKTHTIPALTNTGSDKTEFEIVVLVPVGGEVKLEGVPVGKFTATEETKGTVGYITDFYKVTYNKALHQNDGVTGTNHVVEGEIHGGHPTAVTFTNTYKKGTLTINKTVELEYANDTWTSDTFTFEINGTTELPDGTYSVDGATVTVTGGNVTVKAADGTDPTITVDQVGEPVRLTFKNLPAGYYTVKEKSATLGLDRYDITQPKEQLLVNDTVNATAFDFTNKFIRSKGTLYLEKELVPAEGFNPAELPAGTKFSFTVELIGENLNTEVTSVFGKGSYSDNTAAPASIKIENGKFNVELEAGQNVTLSGLPVGKYRITEATIPQYASGFALKQNDSWVAQESQTTNDGALFTEVEVTSGANTDVKCTNTYPVNRAELIIQKLVTKEYAKDTLPGSSFSFTVTLAEEDLNSYDYSIYSPEGAFVSKDAASVTDKAFTISLTAGQYAVIRHMPVCEYTVNEAVSDEYTAAYKAYVSETGDGDATSVKTSGTASDSGTGASVTRTFVAGHTDTIVFTNTYKRHLGRLTISKTLGAPTVTPNSADSKDFLFHVTGNGVDMDVIVPGDGSVTIYDLPLGAYTVTEDTDWNWRYVIKGNAAQTATLTVAAPDASVSFENTYSENKWLNFFHNVLNEFPKSN